VLRKCADLPPYQEQFTGYGKNKIQHIVHLRHLLYRFSVGGGMFITHFPHKNSDARSEWDRFDKKKRDKLKEAKMSGGDIDIAAVQDYHRLKMDTLFGEFKRWVKEAIGDVYQKDMRYTPLCQGMNDDEQLHDMPTGL
jgi:hypothetical protein